MSFIIDGNLPFTSVENPFIQSAVKYKKCTYKTIMKYLRLTQEKVTEDIKKELPDRFGLIIDGWTEGGRHFLAIFANFSASVRTTTGITYKTRIVLLGMCKLDDLTNQTALNQKNTIGSILEKYGKTFSNVLFLLADNTNVNPAIDNLIGCPFVGCSSHRLYLGVTLILDSGDIASVLTQVDNLVRKLDSSANMLGALKHYTNLTPVRRNDTRVSSTYAMISRYLELHDIIVLNHTALGLESTFLLSDQQFEMLNKFFVSLQEMNEVAIVLQSSDMTCLRMRKLFDYLMTTYPELEEYLSPNAEIVHDKDFENGIVKIMKVKDNYHNVSISTTEATKLNAFKQQSSIVNTSIAITNIRESIGVNDGGEPSIQLSIEERADAAEKRRRVEANIIHQEYMDVDWIQCTSNIVERLFSSARLVFTDYRKSISPKSLELILFLKINREKWSVKDIINIMNNDDDDDDDEDLDGY